MEKKALHLQFIQDVIQRLNGNSFYVKGWSATLVSALFALAISEANQNLLLIACFPCSMFFLLDAYFLYVEQLFRERYDEVRLLDEDKIDFSMALNNSCLKYLNVLFSSTILLFHTTMIVVVLTASLLLWLQK